jgi:hypothetical protein
VKRLEADGVEDVVPPRVLARDDELSLRRVERRSSVAPTQ